MKRIISCLLIATLMLASLIAIIPVSAAAPEQFNVMGGSDKDKQFAGEGNVFYFDYHKFLGLQNSFPMNDAQKGAKDLMLRFETISGSGTASACDGVKHQSEFYHNVETGFNIDGIDYNHVFGYSFKESVIVNNVKIYLPEGTSISAIDVYGASYNPVGPVYGKEAPKTLLAKIANVNTIATTAIEGVNVVVVEADLYEAFELDYIFFALATSGGYKVYEIEANGILAKDSFADFNNNALKEQYDRCTDLNEDDWTATSWTELENALTITDSVNKNPTATEDEIASAAATLKAAIDGLEAKPTDKVALGNLINEANDLNELDYTPKSWAAFEEALKAANDANAKTPISQTEVDDALAALQNAIDALLPPADKTALDAEFTKYGSLKENDYTPKTWDELQLAVAGASAVLADVNATTEEVENATAILKKALDDLQKPGNKTSLELAVKAAKDLVRDDYAVVTLIWNVFQQAIDNADAVLADVNATQADVDAALATLEEKVESLTLKDDSSNSGNTDDDDENNDGNTSDDEDEADATETKAPATEAPKPAKKGCKSTVALSALAIVATVGAALVIKKKD